MTTPVSVKSLLEDTFDQCDPNEPVSQQDLDSLERYLNALWSSLGVEIEFTRHFFDRVNDSRNGRQITVCELKKIFSDTARRYAKQLADMAKNKPGLEGIVKSVSTKINAPFAVAWDYQKGEVELRAKTVMRKAGFVPSGRDKVFSVESVMQGTTPRRGPFAEAVEQQYVIKETDDPYVDAHDMIRNGKSLIDLLSGNVKKVEQAVRSANQQLDGLKRMGSHNISAPDVMVKVILPELKDLQRSVEIVINQIAKIQARTK